MSRVRVTVSGGKLAQPVAETSDDRGEVTIRGLEPGQYKVSLQKAGFFPSSNGDASGYPPTTVVIDKPGEFDLGILVLTKIRSISGRIRWENGDNAEKVIAHALAVRRNGAEFRPGDALLVMADERGEYRIGNLKPGRYVVYCYTLGFAGETNRTPVSLPVYYPGGGLPDIGSAVDVRNVAEASGINMTLHETQGVSIEGTVVPSANLSAGEAVQVGLVIPGSPTQAFAATHASVGEPFRISGVPPGQYDAIILATGHPSIKSLQRVSVDGPMKDLKLSVGQMQTLTGMARYEDLPKPPAETKDTAKPPSPPSGVSLWFASADQNLYGNVLTRTDKDGSISLPVFPGRPLLLTISPPPGVWVSHVRQNGKEIEASPFRIDATGGPIEILLRQDTGSLTGNVHDADGHSAGRAFVVVAPRDRDKAHLFRTSVTGSDGTFSVDALATGEYSVFAFDRNEEDAYLETSYLDLFKAKATALTVTADSKATADLTLLSTSRR